MLKVAPAYPPETDTTDVLSLLCEAICEALEHGLAARPRSGDRHRPATATGSTPG
jgi:hypothetical protein